MNKTIFKAVYTLSRILYYTAKSFSKVYILYRNTCLNITYQKTTTISSIICVKKERLYFSDIFQQYIIMTHDLLNTRLANYKCARRPNC